MTEEPKLVKIALHYEDGTVQSIPMDHVGEFVIHQPEPEPIWSEGTFTPDGLPGIVGYYPPKYVEVRFVGRMYHRPSQITTTKETPDASEEGRSVGKQG